ncbi:hypothetical protein [Ruegeria jejuensis]|uniref:hypothetical protein n=1 Tax=Ruegeria jejuensis TaxID=3233338 RepID=UPI00355BFC0F
MRKLLTTASMVCVFLIAACTPTRSPEEVSRDRANFSVGLDKYFPVAFEQCKKNLDSGTGSLAALEQAGFVKHFSSHRSRSVVLGQVKGESPLTQSGTDLNMSVSFWGSKNTSVFSSGKYNECVFQFSPKGDVVPVFLPRLEEAFRQAGYKSTFVRPGVFRLTKGDKVIDLLSISYADLSIAKVELATKK